MGKEGLEKALTGNFDLIILDLTLPDLDGMEVCRVIREHKVSSAILMLTSKSEETGKVLAPELGADDDVTKPFGIRELMARSKALIRRSEQLPQQTPDLAKEIVVENSGKLITGDLLDCINNSSADAAVHRPKQAGLGLALVKRILYLHRFGFNVDTIERRYNRFIITINCYKKPTQKVL